MIADRAFQSNRSPTRNDLLWTAMQVWAPHEIVTALTRLPDRAFTSADEVWKILIAQDVGHTDAHNSHT